MDIATKLFSLSLGVEPNKDTLKGISEALNGAVLGLADRQKALEQYAETAQSQQYTAAAQKPPPKQKKQVIWQIPESKMKQLEWQRAQLLQFQRSKNAQANVAQLAKNRASGRPAPPKLGEKKITNGTGAKPSPPKSSPSQAPKTPQASQAKKQAPKLGSKASSANGVNGVNGVAK